MCHRIIKVCWKKTLHQEMPINLTRSDQFQARVSKQSVTVILLSFRTDRSGQTVQTQIRLRSSLIRVYTICSRSSLIRVYTVCNFLCLFWMHYSKEKPSYLTFRVITANFRVSEILGFLRYLIRGAPGHAWGSCDDIACINILQSYFQNFNFNLLLKDFLFFQT